VIPSLHHDEPWRLLFYPDGVVRGLTDRLLPPVLDMPRFNPLANVITSSVFRCNIQVRYREQQYQFRQDYFWGGDGLANANSAVAQGVADHFRAALLPCLGSDAIFKGVMAEDLNDLERPPAFHGSTLGPANGTAATVSLPGQLATLFVKSTNLRGQHGRGHAFVPCIPTGFVTEGELNATAVTAYNTLALVFAVPPVATITGQILTPAVASFVGTTPGTRTTRLVTVTGVSFFTEVTDRSTRKVGRGK